MEEHIFPESTTYVHSYQPPPQKERWYDVKMHKSPENSLIEYNPPPFVFKGPTSNSPTEKEYLPPLQPVGGIVKKPADKPSSITSVVVQDLSEKDRALLLDNTYRTTYDDYSRSVPKSSHNSIYKSPHSPLDDKMLLSLNATKPDLAYYGFGLPNKCCEAWSKVQLRAVPQKQERQPEKRQHENPYPGYPHKMDPLIEERQLDPHYDGSFNSGYTGCQRSYLMDYPEDVSRLKRKDFPEVIPRNVTTNEATLVYKTIPQCENEPH